MLIGSFISADNTCFSSPEMEEKKPKKSRSKEKSGQDTKKKQCQSVSESEESAGDSDTARQSEDSDSDKEAHKRLKTQSSASSLLPWITKGSEAASSLPPIRKTATAAPSTAQMLSQFASGTSIAKKQAAESKRKARAADRHVSSDEENDPEDTLSSEFEDSDEELSATEGMTGIKTEVVKFFQTASVDEMSLISGCSVKKAQKIVELRPFDSWSSLVREERGSSNEYGRRLSLMWI